MLTTAISDAKMLSATESPANTIPTTELKFATCDCCGLTEECTLEYIETIRERYNGNWICGLCGEAVKYEIVRSERLITTNEALTRHMTFCRNSKSQSSGNPTVNLIGAMHRILRRSLESPRMLRSIPNSPSRGTNNVQLNRSASYTTLESLSYTDLKELMK